MSQTRFKLAAKNAVIDLTFNIFTLLRTLSIWSMYQFFSGENLKHKKEKVNWWNIAEKVVLNDHDLLIPLYTTEHNYIKNSTILHLKGRGKQNLCSMAWSKSTNQQICLGRFQNSETSIHCCLDERFRSSNPILCFSPMIVWVRQGRSPI